MRAGVIAHSGLLTGFQPEARALAGVWADAGGGGEQRGPVSFHALGC